MTQPVPTNGFVTPTGGALPPADMKPGFVPQNTPPAAAAAPAAGAAPAGAAAAPDLAAAIAALQAAFTPAGATPPAAAPAAAPATPAAESLNTLPLDSITDPILKSMATVMRTAGKGLDMDRVLGKALEHGSPDLIDVAYLKEKAGDSADDLLAIAKGIVEAVNAKAAEQARAIHALAGSEANWNASVAAFNKSAAPELRAVIVQMLDSGNAASIEAAGKLVVQFAKSTGAVPNPAPLVTNGGAAPALGQALSKDEFQAELRKLNPQDRDYVARRGDLYARRQAGKQLGK